MKKIAIYLCLLFLGNVAVAQIERIDEDEDYVFLNFNDSTINGRFIPIYDSAISDSIYAEVFTIIQIDNNGKLEDLEVRGYVEINAQGEYEEYIESEKLNSRLYTALETTIERFIRNHGVFIHPSKENIRGTRNGFDLRIVRCPTTKD